MATLYLSCPQCPSGERKIRANFLRPENPFAGHAQSSHLDSITRLAETRGTRQLPITPNNALGFASTHRVKARPQPVRRPVSYRRFPANEGESTRALAVASVTPVAASCSTKVIPFETHLPVSQDPVVLPPQNNVWFT